MKQRVTKPFPYYVGIYSLEELITKESRVCVVNILGNESRKVTPVSHEYSGGNVVAGVQYGREGVLETKLGNVPVLRSVRDVMNQGYDGAQGVFQLQEPAQPQGYDEGDHNEPGDAHAEGGGYIDDEHQGQGHNYAHQPLELESP